MENLRRIITGHNEEGRSIISIDGPPARILGEDVEDYLKSRILMDNK